jgi:membrane protein implicated in regulation of membrane protease activity
MIGREGIVVDEITPDKPGKIKVMGELWNAYSDQVIPINTIVIIEKADSFTLFVKPK